MSPANYIGPKIKVAHEDNEISLDLNGKKEDKEQDHAWIEDIDFNESRLSLKQKNEDIALFKHFPMYLVNMIQILD